MLFNAAKCRENHVGYFDKSFNYTMGPDTLNVIAK